MAELTATTIKQKRRLDLLFACLGILLCLLATLPQIQVGDYKPHIAFAVAMEENDAVPVPHALFQKLILVLRTALPFRVLQDQSGFWQYLYDHSFTACAILITMAAYFATLWLVKDRFYRAWSSSLGSKAYKYAWLAALGMLLVNPILVFTLSNRLILGYLPTNLWHNPTYVLMRPFALWLFFFIEDHWDQRINGKAWVVVALMSYLMIFAKPNFMLSLLPALAIFYTLRRGSPRHWNWPLLTAVGLPAFFSLVYQYWFMSFYPSESYFAFGPFIGALYYTRNLLLYFLFLLLSILFPVLISIFGWKHLREQAWFQLSWLNFGVALLTFWLFVEQPHSGMLNFMWGLVMASFLVFYYSVEQFVRHWQRFSAQKWQARLLSFVLGLHLLSGVVYTIITIVNPGPVR